jgi:hypothetical protein
MNKLYIRSDTVKSKAVDTCIDTFADNACNSALETLKQYEEAKERLNNAKENNKINYEKLIEILNFLNEGLEVDEFKKKVTTDFKLKSIMCELKTKLCNLDNI